MHHTKLTDDEILDEAKRFSYAFFCRGDWKFHEPQLLDFARKMIGAGMDATDKATMCRSPTGAKEISQALIDIENERRAPIDALSFMFGVRFAEQRLGVYGEEESK